MTRRFALLIRLQVLAMVLAAGTCAAAAVETPPGFDYPSNLREVYGAYQAILARRDTCITAFPKSRPAAEKAFASWQSRHRKLIDELDQRVAMMIRGASKDDKDYARNFGKYQGAIVKQREDAKQALLLETRGDLEARCKGLPEFLQSRESDLETEFAEEWIVLRQWQLAPR